MADTHPSCCTHGGNCVHPEEKVDNEDGFYENVDPNRQPASSAKPSSTSESDSKPEAQEPYETLENLTKVAREKAKKDKKLYLGVKTWDEAERETGSNVKLYHLMEGDATTMNGLQTNMGMFVVFRDTDGSFKHYRVVLKSSTDGPPGYFVENGDPQSQKHDQLDSLVRYYKKKYCPRY